MTNVYPVRFEPLYKEKIWGGRNLERLFGRNLPPGKSVGESWELADLAEGVSVVANGPAAGTSLTDLTSKWGRDLLGRSEPMADGRFPLLLKFLDANDVLSLQVHPDEEAVAEIGREAALKTECWYVVESRGGAIFKGVRAGIGPDRFREAVLTNAAEEVVRRIPVEKGDFHYLPAGTVHAMGAGLVIAEIQTPSDTTYRVTDWGRGRDTHLDRSMQCIRFNLDDSQPGAAGEILLVTDFFTVSRRSIRAGESRSLAPGKCVAVMVLAGAGTLACRSGGAATTPVSPGETLLVPAALQDPRFQTRAGLTYLEVSLPEVGE
jgi:mannose-6-phosphate isomerase